MATFAGITYLSVPDHLRALFLVPNIGVDVATDFHHNANIQGYAYNIALQP